MPKFYTDKGRGFESKLTPWNHQKIALDLGYDNERYMYAMDMGTGKTKTTIDFSTLVEAERVFIACPKKVVDVWPLELQKHSERNFAVVIPPRYGTAKSKAIACYNEIERLGRIGVPLFFAINYELAWRPPFDKLLFEYYKPDLIVADESHRIKNDKAKQSKFLFQLGRETRFKLCLTGTPMGQSPLDIYGQFKFMDYKIFNRSYFHFLKHFAETGPFAKTQVVGFKNLDELNEIYNQHAFTVDADDVQELPPLVEKDIEVPLDKSTLKAYLSIEQNLFAEFSEGRVDASNAMVKTIRLQQLISGYFKDSDSGREIACSDEKVEALKELLTDLPPDSPVVVFTVFRNEAKRIEAEMKKVRGKEPLLITGDKNDYEEFRTSKEPRDVIVNIASGGEGIDLTRARYAIYFSNTHSLLKFKQSKKRIHRPGQEKKTFIFYLLAKKPKGRTIDDIIRYSHETKSSVVEEVMRCLSEREF